MPVGAPNDVGFGERRVEDAVVAEFALQAEGELEDAAFPFHLLLLEILFAAAIGNVFAEDDDAFVALHFVAQAVALMRSAMVFRRRLPSSEDSRELLGVECRWRSDRDRASR